jgi:putative methyltransferase (TIGR04325 family)
VSEASLAALKRWVPPVAWSALKSHVGTRFSGDYPSWAAASADSRGYDAPAIAARVAEATRKLVRGEAAFERDSILFDEPDYPWPLLTCLLYVAARREGTLGVVDFGGSLGSTYRQCAKFLSGVKRLSWTVVEQPTFVALGRREFTTPELSFHDDLATALFDVRPDVLLLSSVLQYVEEPHAVLATAVESDVPFILLDRTPFIDAPKDRLTVQTVSKRVYPASYPAWFFSRERLLTTLARKYRKLEEFAAIDQANVSSRYLGMLFERNA